MNNVQMIPVSSSNVESVGYCEDQQTLYVRFLNNSEYTYAGVPEPIFRGLLEAPSVGSYLNRNVKGIYPYQRIG